MEGAMERPIVRLGSFRELALDSRRIGHLYLSIC